ncbi:MAG: glycosyltransferase family 4 protein, partial [Promethearchaeota archaeon]
QDLVAFNAIKERIKTQICQILEENEIEIIIVHNIPSMPFNFPALVAVNEAAEKCNGKMFYWIHDSIVFREMYKDRLNEYPFTEVHHTHENIEYITITHYRARQFAETEYERFRIEDVTVVPNGIDLDDFLKLDKHTLELKEHLDINHHDYVILVPVRITPRKNIELALYVINELRNLIRTGNIKLLVSGPPDNQAYVAGKKYMSFLKDITMKLGLSRDVLFCHNLISKERVFKQGKLVKWGISDIYNLADLVFVPSKEEGFGLPIIEAGASQKPLFCSRIEPFAELVRDNIEAYMFGLDELPQSIAFRIHRFLISSAVNLNFRNVLQNFMWSKIVKNKVLPLLIS